MDEIRTRQPNLSNLDVPGVTVAPPEPLAVRIPEACRISGIGRSKLYELMGAGEIEVVKVGAITLIPMDSLRLFMQARRR
jgi:hypothetical protein